MDWWEAGACHGMRDNSVFFLDSAVGQAQAKTICARCQVTERCLDEAFREQDWVAVRGGTTPDERKRLAKGKVA